VLILAALRIAHDNEATFKESEADDSGLSVVFASVLNLNGESLKD
jgi:hypothetical protein